MSFRNYLGLGTRVTVQTAPIPGSNQVQNSAGGYVWKTDDWKQVERFLILGAPGHTYYASQQDVFKTNANIIHNALKEDGTRLVQTIVDISFSGRAPKNDPALFALAIAAGAGDAATRKAALAALPKVARTGTHLFHFLEYVQQFRGWGRGLRDAVASWYTNKPNDKLATHAIKYQQRDGWTNRDALRLSHAVTKDPTKNALFHWMVKGWPDVGEVEHPDPVLRTIWAFERLKLAKSEQEVAKYITGYALPWEAVPSQWLKSKLVWEALLPTMLPEATLRNLGRLTALGLLSRGSEYEALVAERLTNRETLRRARLHPIKILAAGLVYGRGHGDKGNLTWTPSNGINTALDQAYYLSFQTIQPTNKTWMLGVDISGSMGGGEIAGLSGMTPRIAAAAMAMVTLRTEEKCYVKGFSHNLVDLPLTRSMTLPQVVDAMSRIPFGGTDASLPIKFALQTRTPVDAFAIYSDNETWAGTIHAAQALQQYRRSMGINAKLVAVDFVSNPYTIVDPNDDDSIYFAGFDTAAPSLMADFVTGENSSENLSEDA